jgi:hypothetical protein
VKETLLGFDVRNNGTERIVTSIWAVGEPVGDAPTEEREERFTDLHKLQVCLLGLARQIDWVLVA